MHALFPPTPTLLHAEVFQRRALSGLPALEVPDNTAGPGLVSRRGFLAAATAALSAAHVHAQTAGPLVFSPGDLAPEPKAAPSLAHSTAREGEVPSDFWERPRELWLRRHRTNEEERVVYWQDGKLVAEGYWRACALLKDRRANLMTAIDPTLLDVLRGINGYYQAWNWNHPIVITSGYRSPKTNSSTEGAARNSLHLQGKAADLFVPGIPVDHIRRLGLHLQQGGVGFYPDNGFTHLDTGRIRSWRG